MTYFVTNISKTQYTSVEVTIKPNIEVEVSKSTYDYLNNVFGSTGRFTFRTLKSPSKKITPKKEEPVVETKTPVEKTERKTKSKK